MRTHGLASTYRAGCRCDECTTAHTEWAAEKRAERKGRPAAEIPHGRSGYRNWGCRCEVCKAAGAVENARFRAERKAAAR